MHFLRYLKYLVARFLAVLRSPRDFSYSQHSEDLVVLELLGTVRTFIDIGANDGITFSNTYFFARNGSRGLCFEPVRLNCRKARFFHLLHPGVKCINEGISRQVIEGRVVIAGYEGLLSSATDQTQTEEVGSKTQAVTLRPLSYWLRRYPSYNAPDLVSIDVEGHELAVLEGIDFTNLSARCFVVETDKVAFEEIDKLLSSNGYEAKLANECNTFWFAKDTISPTLIGEVCERYPSYRALP